MKGKVIRALAAAACIGAGAAGALALDGAPIVPGSLRIATHEGVSDDLLSAGLNFDGFVSAAPPGFADPANPTPAELRRRAIHGNYRGIVDPVPAGGMGVFWGPQSPGTPDFTAQGVPFGLVPGVEYRAYLRDFDHKGHVNNIPAAVQIPRHFDPAKPCIVAAAPSGSRSYYGGIAVGEWGLFKGCAVALPGKGTDTGFHLLGAAAAAHAVNDLDGVFEPEAQLGDDAQFALQRTNDLAAYLVDSPHRIATKHAHSQLNPERLWGDFTLMGIEFAFFALNDHFGTQGRDAFDRRNTIVIAAGGSNGGGMALRALEADEKDLIDGLVVTEPQVGPGEGRFAIRFGNDAPFAPAGRSTYDSLTMMSVWAPCAALSPTLAGTPFFGAQPLFAPPLSLQNRCASLKEKGLVSGATLAEQSASALAVLRANGYAAAQDWGIASHEFLNLWRALQATYANAYGRFAVEENVCGVSIASVDATLRPAPLPANTAKALFADSSGVPPTPGVGGPGAVNLIADRASNGPILENLGVSRSTGRTDLNLDSALCFRHLETGAASLIAGLGLAEREARRNHEKVVEGTRAIETTGRLHRKPAIVIHGRRDALVFPNTHSRAYYALNQLAEGNRSRLSYIEVSTGQHFDTFISGLFLGPTGAQFVPLHYYLVKAMDSMYAHLTTGAALPPSQVVRPTPRGVQPYSAANEAVLLPRPATAPAAGNRITFADGVLFIPE